MNLRDDLVFKTFERYPAYRKSRHFARIEVSTQQTGLVICLRVAPDTIKCRQNFKRVSGTSGISVPDAWKSSSSQGWTPGRQCHR